jgi:hypothetical protein
LHGVEIKQDWLGSVFKIGAGGIRVKNCKYIKYGGFYPLGNFDLSRTLTLFKGGIRK